jgi:hypothetical protein
MVSVDLPIALAIFLAIFLTVVVVVVNYFSGLQSSTGIQELRQKAESLYNLLFKTQGPQNWEQSGNIPVAPGVLIELKKIPVMVNEKVGLNRTNEPLEIPIIFDDDCENKTWNDTVRVYDYDLNETASNLTEQNFCFSQFLRNATVIFNVNISAGESKRFGIYFSDDQTIEASNNTISCNTANWIPNDGDAWTETTTDWSRYGGSSGTVTLDTGSKEIGAASVNLTGTFNSQALGLDYNPSGSITGVSNGWYLRAWLFVDNTGNLNNINVSVSDGSNVITLNVSDITSSTWYLFEKNLSQTVWANWSSFDASNGIDFVRFFATNTTTGLTKTVKIDGLRFEKAPLETVTFPEETIEAISSSKTKGLRNISSGEITATGEGYGFRVEIEK